MRINKSNVEAIGVLGEEILFHKSEELVIIKPRNKYYSNVRLKIIDMWQRNLRGE